MILRAPLVPVALAFTAGIVLDRQLSIPLPLSLATVCALLFAWTAATVSPLKSIALLFLAPALFAAGAAWHQWYRESVVENDIRFLATLEGRPTRLRGVLAAEPIAKLGVHGDALRSFDAKPSSQMTVDLREVLHRDQWYPASGSVQAMLARRQEDLHVGDEIELVGRLLLPQGAANPGGFDYAEYLADQRIGAVLAVPDAPDAVRLVRQGWPGSLFGWLAVLRGRAARLLETQLPKEQSGVAEALLLGESNGMTGDDWDVYLRTGVIHVLAISGQHLVVLAGFLWLASRVLFVKRRVAALVIAALLVGYALLTGARPPVMRAAWMVAAYTGGMLLRRPVLPANTFALAWLGVAAFNPTDIFNTGCQLSFLAVAVLVWGTSRWQTRDEDPLEKLIDESRSWLTRGVLRFGRWLAWMVALNAVVWLAVAPLVAARYHLVSPVALVIGPPVVLLTSIALLLGFALLLTAPLLGSLALPFAWSTKWSLFACEATVGWSSRWPGAYFFVPDMPAWWLVVFYVGLFCFLTVPPLQRRPAVALAASAVWLALGLVLILLPPRPGEFRCTFLAVGHGGSTVIETPNGRVFVYDTGAIGGPDVARRHIAPFLWQRGYRHIDEIFISHGDLDHFNGLPALLERFSIGRVNLTPTFAERTTPGVTFTLRALERAGMSARVLHAPAQWETDGIGFDALHPPASGPEGNENSRSLVMAVRCRDMTILLTGDLEGTGLERVLAMPPRPVDILMAPHHGSRTSNKTALAEWSRPKFVVSCQGPPKSVPREPNPYEALGARYLGTWPHGAVTIRSQGNAFLVETYLTKNQWTIGAP